MTIFGVVKVKCQSIIEKFAGSLMESESFCVCSTLTNIASSKDSSNLKPLSSFDTKEFVFCHNHITIKRQTTMLSNLLQNVLDI